MIRFDRDEDPGLHCGGKYLNPRQDYPEILLVRLMDKALCLRGSHINQVVERHRGRNLAVYPADGEGVGFELEGLLGAIRAGSLPEVWYRDTIAS